VLHKTQEYVQIFCIEEYGYHAWHSYGMLIARQENIKDGREIFLSIFLFLKMAQWLSYSKEWLMGLRLILKKQ